MKEISSYKLSIYLLNYIKLNFCSYIIVTRDIETNLIYQIINLSEKRRKKERKNFPTILIATRSSFTELNIVSFQPITIKIYIQTSNIGRSFFVLPST